MHFLVYVSDYTGKDSELQADLEGICEASKRNNPKNELTGLLFFQSGKFVQAIEGDEDAIEGLMTRVDTDPRHANIKVVVDEAVSERSFPEWNMDTFNMDDYQDIDIDSLFKLKTDFNKQMQMDAGFFVRAMKSVLADSKLKSL